MSVATRDGRGLSACGRSRPRARRRAADPHLAAGVRNGGRGLMARAWKFGDDLDTDQILPGRYAPFMTGQDKFHAYAFHDARPEFATSVMPGDVLVGGENFGCGSSREDAVGAVKVDGIGGGGATRFARVFFRHCINLGIPVLASG